MNTSTREKCPSVKRVPAADRIKASGLALACLVFIGYFAACGSQPPAVRETEEMPVKPEPTQVRFEFPEADYSQFSHDNEQHARLPCLVCHTREDNSAAMKFPGHIPCASCHTEHFADTAHQICSICHTDAATGSMKPFPTLSSYRTKFDHGKHLPHSNCTDCHSPARSGSTFSVPTRSNSHATCFQCHNPDSEFQGRDIASCSTCHEAGSPGPRRGGVRALPARFDHAAHGPKQRLSCNSCHTVRAGAVRGRQVFSPSAVMHLASARGQTCATCHNGKRAFGEDDFANCKRCHQGSGFGF